MEKYEKLFKGLEMCAGPDCNPECPYHGETRGGKPCRVWLLNDAAAALTSEESLAYAYKVELEKANKHIDAMEVERDAKKAPVAVEVAKVAIQAMKDAEYWHGQADALKWCMELATVEGNGLDLPDMHGEPEPEADDHV